MLSDSGKSIPDYPPQEIDTSTVLRIRPHEFQLIILRLTEGRVCICVFHHKSRLLMQLWFVMIVID